VQGLTGRYAALSISGGLKLGGLGGADGFAPGLGAPTAHFRIYTAHAGIDQALPLGFSAQLDLGAQATPDTVPSYEQWVLGGWSSLSAWLPGTLVGDRGYMGRFSLQAPNWKVGDALKLRAGLFAEYAAARYTYVPTGSPTWQGLSDAGASLTLDLPHPGAHALFAYAHPLGQSHVPYDVRRHQRAHAFVYLQLDF
jgi:hemolysin activation/secretion protein